MTSWDQNPEIHLNMTIKSIHGNDPKNHFVCFLSGKGSFQAQKTILR